MFVFGLICFVTVGGFGFAWCLARAAAFDPPAVVHQPSHVEVLRFVDVSVLMEDT